ncbi:Thoeris anti-defense Tad2 family protein [Yersinia ruckeri]|uniref:Thoeris anti-defense Tad2 family protein n=1 Tax=Yersinia ruckeri TaxID=29486 RepID=UPI0020C07D90|nr:hypothetical protein [Yersinia ruckeri]MCK8586362.1 hypothetical protein [Yersinia ruckeri]MCW6615603.1 hypothetical protein [Yersinia ruckeri]
MKFDEVLFYEWLQDEPNIKRQSTKQKVAHCMVCLLELYIENGGEKVKTMQLYERAGTNKADLHYAAGGLKNLWRMIRRATKDYEYRLSKEQKVIIDNIFIEELPDNNAACDVDVPEIILMDYPAALRLMIRRGYGIYRINWQGGHVALRCDKRKGDDSAEFIFIAPDGVSIPWSPSVQDQLADNWAVYVE